MTRESMTRILCPLAVMLLLVGPPVEAQTPSTERSASAVTERFSKTVHLDENGTLDVTNVTGNIVVGTRAGRDVTIDAVKRVERPNPNVARALLAMIDVQVSEQGNRVEVRTIVPRPRNFPGAVDYTITVPADARVSVRTTSGTIRTTNVVVDTLKVVSGDIEVTDGSADFFSASSVSGSIAVRRLNVGAMQLNTVSGSVTLDTVRAERVVARAISGDIHYSGELAAGGRYELVSHAGNIEVLLPAATGFQLQANTFSGSVRSDFAVARRGRANAEELPTASPRALRGAFGDASAMLVVRAFSGNISVSKR